VFYFFQVRNIYEFSANFVVDFGTMKKTKGVISGGDLLTVEAGAEILKAGGNAFDACIAATFMSFAASSSITSAGGGGFLLAYPEAGRPLMYDFFVQTPRTKRRESEIDFRSVLVDFGDKTQEFHVGLGSVAVPGNIAGLLEYISIWVHCRCQS
jgi:gamma-glutamyltranspeptidase/glutathione hydrolase